MATHSHFKLVCLGNAGVGKSALVLRFVRNEWVSDTDSTVGAAFLTKTLSVDGVPVKVEVWDTAGQERYRSLAPMYYRGAQAAIVVFDLTNRESFEGAKTWVRELQKRADPSIVVSLAGNKSDLAPKRKVDVEEAQEYAREQGLMYVETSAKDATNIEALFLDVARRVPKTAAKPRQDVVLGRDARPPLKEAGAASKSGCC